MTDWPVRQIIHLPNMIVGTAHTVAMLAQAQKMGPRVAWILLTLLALLMAARARKRSAVAEVRELAASLGEDLLEEGPLQS